MRVELGRLEREVYELISVVMGTTSRTFLTAVRADHVHRIESHDWDGSGASNEVEDEIAEFMIYLDDEVINAVDRRREELRA